MKKILSGLLMGAFLLATGCGSKTAETETTTQAVESQAATEEATTEEVIVEAATATETVTEATPSGEKEEIIVVTSGGGLPYSLLEGDDQWSGIEADMWQEIGNRSNLNVTVKRAAFDALFGELDSGRADVAANCFAQNEERAEKYYMTIPFYGDAQCLALNMNTADINSFEDLKGKKVGVTAGQASQTILEDMATEYGFELVVYEVLNTGYSDVSLGRIDAMGGPVTGVNQFNDTAAEKIKILDQKLKANNVVYYIPKTEKGEALRDQLNEVIQTMLDDGTCGKITEKWLFEDMTTYIQQ